LDFRREIRKIIYSKVRTFRANHIHIDMICTYGVFRGLELRPNNEEKENHSHSHSNSDSGLRWATNKIRLKYYTN
jgi:hypothetical protein